MAEETIMTLTELGAGKEGKLLDEFDRMCSSGLRPFVMAALPGIFMRSTWEKGHKTRGKYLYCGRGYAPENLRVSELFPQEDGNVHIEAFHKQTREPQKR